LSVLMNRRITPERARRRFKRFVERGVLLSRTFRYYSCTIIHPTVYGTGEQFAELDELCSEGGKYERNAQLGRLENEWL